MKKVLIDGANIHVDTLAVIHDEQAGISRLTCTVSKEHRPEHVVIAQIAYSPFKGVLEEVKKALELYWNRQEEKPSLLLGVDKTNTGYTIGEANG